MGNKIFKSKHKSVAVDNLEQAIAHKEWLVNNVPNQSKLDIVKEVKKKALGIKVSYKLNPHNKQSKYYYYENVEVKHKTKVLYDIVRSLSFLPVTVQYELYLVAVPVPGTVPHIISNNEPKRDL